VLAVHPVPREIALVQVTTAENLAHRLAKMKAVPELAGLLAAGVLIHVHGWTRREGCWVCKTVQIRAEDLSPIVVCNLPRQRCRRLHQGTLCFE